MKIFKWKKGFTTNSSGTNEWVSAQQTPSNTPSVNHTWNNLGKLSLLVVFVSLLIFIDQTARKIFSLKKIKPSKESDL